MKQRQEGIQIYVACLAAYNNGILHGAWIDAVQDAHDIWEEISCMLRASPIPNAEEWAIHDYEGFECLRLSENEGLEEVAKKAAFIEEHGELGAEIATYYGGDLEDAQRALRDHYAGVYRSVADFAEEITETSDVPEHLKLYIDFEAMGRDMAIGDLITFELGFGEIHIFWSH